MIYHLTDMPSGDIKYPGSTGIAGFIKMVGDRIFLRCLRINRRLYARDLAFILLSILGIPIAGRTVSRRGRRPSPIHLILRIAIRINPLQGNPFSFFHGWGMPFRGITNLIDHNLIFCTKQD